MAVSYFCKLRPLGEYFLGGEKTFDFGGSKESVKSNYFIHSEEEISQATILGMMRFVILKKNNSLSDGWNDKRKKDKQDELIGRQGFTIDNNSKDLFYGKLKSISPILIYKADKPLVHVPLNHKKVKTNTYTPFQMEKRGYSDLGGTTYLPTDFVAKDGLSYDYMSLEDGRIVEKSKIFTTQIRTHIAKNSTEDGFFKRTYQFLNKEYSFGFYVLLEDDWCPEKKIKNEIVYMGQEKSAFELSFEEKEEIRVQFDNYNNGNQEYKVYYMESDTYFDNFLAVKKMLCYAIVEKKTYRFLTSTQEANINYLASRKMSKRFQFVKAGSVFYVFNDKEDAFIDAYSNSDLSKALQLIGFNKVIKIGE